MQLRKRKRQDSDSDPDQHPQTVLSFVTKVQIWPKLWVVLTWFWA
jgi:hypothetical protein